MKKILSGLMKLFYGRSVTSKPYAGTSLKLFYEQAQHLVFAFKPTIQYESILQQKVRKYVTSGDTVFDIGANIGQYALLFSQIIGPYGKVICLEPDFKNFAFLQFNIHINKLYNVLCLNKGVGHSNEILEFYRDTETGGRKGSFDQTFVDENYKGFKENVEIVTMDNLVTQFGEPSFIKIDVEGFEAVVLSGLVQTLVKTTFLVEVRGETKSEVFEYFRHRGYECLLIDNQEDVKIEDASSLPNFANLIFFKA